MKKLYLSIVLPLLFAVLSTGSFAQQKKAISLTGNGKFFIGCNYWASHAGTNMWKDWRPDVVESDFRQIAGSGMQVIRVFPLWPDFQPIYQYYSGGGSPKEIRFKDGALPGTGPGKDGVSTEALAHFRQLAELAQKYDIKLVVGLVTGWMSGQLFVPPALEGRKILSDPVSIMWQIKYVRSMVHELKDEPAIIAWDLGNECNVMEDVGNSQTAYSWTAAISNTIRAEDPTRTLVSGMDDLTSDPNGKWRIQDQGELTDLLTTHPYLLWTPYAKKDPANTIRAIMLSAAETEWYGDIGGKPSLVEETGIMGPMEANEKVKSDYLRSILFNDWAHNCRGVMWWCAYDLNHLDFTPYEWYAVERDLGLFKNDRTAKPLVNEIKGFRKFMDALPFDALPERKKEAVCILTEGQDQWAVAYSSFILAKQAGFDIEFQLGNQPVKDADLYILPGIKGLTLINRTDWLGLLEKVKEGASLYVSFDGGFLSPFNEPAGIEIVSAQDRNEAVTYIPENDSVKPFALLSGRKLNIRPTTAKVLAREKDGNPVFTVNSYGKGKIYFLSVPLEMSATETAGSFTDSTSEYWKIYQTIASDLIKRTRTVTKTDPLVGITEHDLSATQKVIVLVNYSPNDKSVALNIKPGWTVERALYGNKPVNSVANIKANDANVLMLKKN